MLLILSPAKSMDFDSPAPITTASQPLFVPSAKELIKILCDFDVPALAQLMHISGKLAALNMARNHQWHPSFKTGDAKQAIYAFTGDVYEGFDASSLSESEIMVAQNTVRSLSGLYGILRPLDLMHPYRLEMGTKLSNSKGKDLYAFWGNRLVDHLNTELDAHEHPYLINLASDEYFKAVPIKSLKHPLIQPVFQEHKNGTYKIISFYAKRARGLMARFIVQHNITQPEQLKNFSVEGYQFLEEKIAKNGAAQMVFVRDD